MPSILIAAGENSGDKYGADLIKQFKIRHPEIRFFGVGGSHMSEGGADLLYSVQDLAVVGVFEVLSHLPRIKRIFNGILAKVDEEKPVAAVLIDSPDFNLRLAKTLNQKGIPVLYYVSPTVWAWRRNRLKTIKKYVDRMLLIFPFEVNIYESHRIPSTFIGHPLVERVRASLSREEFLRKHELDPDRPLISILPGSRSSEIKFHMPVLIKSLPGIHKSQDSGFVFLVSENLDQSLLKSYSSILDEPPVFLSEDKYDAMAYSDIVLASCGTANLEAALLGTPVVAYYRLSPLTYTLGIPFVRIRNYSIVNILAGRKVIPELIQRDFTPENLIRETAKILDDSSVRRRMLSAFKEIKEGLGQEVASANAAIELETLIDSKHS